MASNTESDYIIQGGDKGMDGEKYFDCMGNDTTEDIAKRFPEVDGMSNNEPIKHHERICKEMNELYAKKNHDYGDSFHKSYEEWGSIMVAIRLGDKYNRFCRLIKAEAEVEDESIRDTLIDLANYAIMTVMEMDGNDRR